MTRVRVRCLCACVGGWVVACAPAFGNGYKILGMRSAKATGMGEAFVVQADDPSAVALNPAGIAQLQGTQCRVETALGNAYIEHESPAGQKTKMGETWQAVPSFFATSDVGTDRVGVGLGVTVPNGLSSEWAEDSFARYVATYSSLWMADIGPAVGVRVGDRLLLGAGVDFLYGTARLERMVDWGAMAGFPGAMDGKSVMEADGTGWGCNAGLIYAFNARHGAAVTWRSPVTLAFKGDVTLGDVPAGGATTTLRSDAATSIELPMSVVVGYAYRPSPKLKLELDADWTNWEPVGDYTIEFDSPAMTDSVVAQEFDDTIAWKFGAEYRHSDSLAIRAGYLYNRRATSEETWRPNLVDTDGHFLTGGLGYRLGSLVLDLAVQVVFYEPTTIDNNVDGNETTTAASVDGTYGGWAPCLSLGAAYGF